MAAKKHRVDGISLSIVILNILIVAVLITLVVLIYLYMTGKLEDTNVSNLDQPASSAAAITTTPVSTVIAEPEIETSETSETDTPDAEIADESTETEESTEETTAPEPTELDTYDPAFFENDLFIGDSIYTGLVGYEYFPAKNVFAQIGLNPESVRTKSYDGITAVSKAKDMQPKRIFIMLGSNGLAYMGNTHMAEQMRQFTKELREACPDSYIYVVSIPPVTKDHDALGQETMVMVNGYNKLLRTMCEEESIVYLDLCSQLQDSSGYFSDKYAEADGLHFLGTAYVHMLSFFQKSIQL